jgi:hypothetical protein
MITQDDQNGRNPKENRQMKKLMTLMAAAALTFGAVTMYGAPQKKTTKVVTKSTKTITPKGTKTVKKSTVTK